MILDHARCQPGQPAVVPGHRPALGIAAHAVQQRLLAGVHQAAQAAQVHLADRGRGIERVDQGVPIAVDPRVLGITEEGVALAIAAARAGQTPVVIADHADRTGNSTHILEALIRQEANNFCIATIADKKCIDEIVAEAAIGESVTVDVGGYADRFAGKPVSIAGTVEYLGDYEHFDTIAVLRFGDNNRVIVTPQLHQVTTPEIFETLGIDIAECDIISLKSRVHFRRGFHETGLAGAIIEIDTPGLGPADLTTLEYKNVPKDLYPIYRTE